MLNRLRRNLGVKIVSVFLAALFWLFVMNEKTLEILTADQQITIPLVTARLPRNMVVMTPLPSVRVRLQGISPSTNIQELYAQVDLSGGEAGENSYAVMVNSPIGVNLVEVQPAKVQLLLDTVQEKPVHIEVVVSGYPAEGYKLGASYVRPSAVNLRGPSSILSSLNQVFVDVSVTGVSETVQVFRPVSIRDGEGNPIIGPNPSVEFLSTSPNTVDVIVPVIAEELVSKSVPLRVASSGTPAPGKILRSLILSQTNVQVLGTEQNLAGFDVLDLGVVDVTGLAEDKVFPFAVERIQLPEGVSFYEGTALSVMARIEAATVQKEIPGVGVQIRNLRADLILESPIPLVTVVIEGKSDILEQITPDQIELWVDAMGQAEGTYEAEKVFGQFPLGVAILTNPEVSYTLKKAVSEEEE